MTNLLLPLTLALAGCAAEPRMPDCVDMATGGEVCAVPDREEAEARATALAWFETYSGEWGAAAASDVLTNIRIIMGPIHQMRGCPCARDAAGCHVHWTQPDEIWVSTRDKHGDLYAPCRGALAHELVHAAEWQIEQRIDYEHDDVPRRWEMVGVAKARCEEIYEESW